MNARTLFPSLLSLMLLLPVLGACEEDEKSEDVVVEEADMAEVPTSTADVAAIGPDGRFASSEGGFSLVFPEGSSTPQKQVIPVPTEIGQINMNMFLVDAGENAYMAAWADYPEELVSSADPQNMLDMGRDGAIANVNGELLRENDYRLQGFPAKEFYARGEQGGEDVFMRANILMAGNRLFQILYLAFDEAQLDSPAADEYVASFRIDEIEAGEEEGVDE